MLNSAEHEKFYNLGPRLSIAWQERRPLLDVRLTLKDFPDSLTQLNFNGSNIFGTMQICSTQGKFELMSVYHSARSGGIVGILGQKSNDTKYSPYF